MAFGYFEVLNRAQDIGKINEEISRLQAFNKAVLDESHTYSNGVYIDWADEALDLLKELAQSSFSLDGVAKLELAFNDPDRGPNILQYFRVSFLHTIIVQDLHLFRLLLALVWREIKLFTQASWRKVNP